MVTRPFRGDIYVVTLQNLTSKGTRVFRIQLDGRELEGTLLKPIGDGGTHHVRVIIA